MENFTIQKNDLDSLEMVQNLINQTIEIFNNNGDMSTIQKNLVLANMGLEFILGDLEN